MRTRLRIAQCSFTRFFDNCITIWWFHSNLQLFCKLCTTMKKWGRKVKLIMAHQKRLLFIKVADKLLRNNSYIKKSCKYTFYYLFSIRAFKSCTIVCFCSMIHLYISKLSEHPKKCVLISYKVNLEKIKVESVWFPNGKLFHDNVACRIISELSNEFLFCFRIPSGSWAIQ